MNIKELKARVHAELGEDSPGPAAIGRILAALGVVIQWERVEDEKDPTVALPGLGKLAVVIRGPRTGHNPQIGETIRVPEKRVVTFRPAAGRKEAVAG